MLKLLPQFLPNCNTCGPITITNKNTNTNNNNNNNNNTCNTCNNNNNNNYNNNKSVLKNAFCITQKSQMNAFQSPFTY